MLMSCAVSYQLVDSEGVIVLWIRLLDIGHWQQRDGAENRGIRTKCISECRWRNSIFIV